jgi:hypothetical protein
VFVDIQPLSTAARAALAEKHRETSKCDNPACRIDGACWTCEGQWPCEMRRALATIDAYEQQSESLLRRLVHGDKNQPFIPPAYIEELRHQVASMRLEGDVESEGWAAGVEDALQELGIDIKPQLAAK